MGKKGKAEWDAEMVASGHRLKADNKKKWGKRLRGTTINSNVVDNATREQILNERLEVLEKDNYDDEETINEADVYNVAEDNLNITPKKRKVQKKLLATLPVLNFMRIAYQDKNRKELEGKPSYITAASGPSQYPPRKFCLICGYPYHSPQSIDFTNTYKAIYRCKFCGSLYCCYDCQKKHEETKCINMK